jgi:pimeloyl-ACP methyl ester carboxylesterase
MAAASDARYTLDLLPGLRERRPPALLIWGEDDEFQPVGYAERFAADLSSAALARVPGARHIPMEDDPDRVTAELLAFLGLAAVARSM